MSVELIIGENSIDPTTWEKVVEDKWIDYLVDRYGKMPPGARMYHDVVSGVTDITPVCEADIDNLTNIDGRVYFIIFPQASVTLIVGLVIAVALTAAAMFLFAPSIDIPTIAAARDQELRSSSNELSDRQNRARLNQRIPDIYGTVRSVPDLLAVPYKVFQSHQEVEYAYMCIGRGRYNIDPEQIYDDTTRINAIPGTSIGVYHPNTSPNTTSSASSIQIGNAINEPIYAVKRHEAVNGQVLRPTNVSSLNTDNLFFVSESVVAIPATSDVDLTDLFVGGDVLSFEFGGTNAVPPPRDLDGTFTVLGVTQFTITLDDPESTTPDWGNIQPSWINTEKKFSVSIQTTSDKWVGPFRLEVENPTQIVANFVANNGLYKDTGRQRSKVSVEIELEITPRTGTTPGAPVTHTVTLNGSATTIDRSAVTLRAPASVGTSFDVRARRTTATDTAFIGSVIDEVKWRDIYSLKLVDDNDFGDVTTVQSLTYATAGALAVKKRKLNMIVTRMVPQRAADGSFTLPQASKNAADIIMHVCQDSKIGRRPLVEIDVDNIYNTIQAVEDYFGSVKATEFCYTFDRAAMSFEEIMASIANAVFCTAYRKGNIIKLFFQREKAVSSLLFNHRNKRPGSETRSISFGRRNDHDGVEYQWVDPEDDAIVTRYVPVSATATNPLKIDSIGVRNGLQAHFHAQRAWQKLQYQNIAVEFIATQEADLLIIGDRILVADNTRPETIDGAVVDYIGTTVTLSNPAPAGRYNIFLRQIDETVESVACTVTEPNLRAAVLDSAPRMPLVYDREKFARTPYQMVEATSGEGTPFLVTEKHEQRNFSYRVSAINYHPNYYRHDGDYKSNVINENGESV